MNTYTISLTANNGISIKMPSGIIWIDALHHVKTTVYSTLDEEIKEWFFSDPDTVGSLSEGPDVTAFTHCHTDHFSAKLARYAKDRWPRTKLVIPEAYFPDQILPRESFSFSTAGDTVIDMIKAPHSGKEYKTHNSFYIGIRDAHASILITGDTAISDQSIREYALKYQPDIAFVNFAWLLFNNGREAIEKFMNPKHLFITHLPFEKDDTDKLLPLSRKAAAKLKGSYDLCFLDQRFQKETVSV